MKKDSLRTRQSKTTTVELKNRIVAIIPDLPTDYIQIVCQMAPEYDTKEGRELISNVKNMRRHSEDVTNLLERVAIEYRNMINNLIEAN